MPNTINKAASPPTTPPTIAPVLVLSDAGELACGKIADGSMQTRVISDTDMLIVGSALLGLMSQLSWFQGSRSS